MKESDLLLRGYYGSLIADALAMPVHWYYNRDQLDLDYGEIDRFYEPKKNHPDSIFWRSSYQALNSRGEILHANKKYWGIPSVHYHRGFQAGENTLNFKLAGGLFHSVVKTGDYEPAEWAQSYVDFMLDPAKQNDTYVEEYHRGFFTHYAKGKALLKCGIRDQHIGGLAQVPALIASLAMAAQRNNTPLDREALRDQVKMHVALTHRHSNVIRAADCLVRLIWSLHSGTPLKEALKKDAGDWFSCRKAEGWARQLDRVVIGQKISPACYIDQAFPAALYLSWKYDGDFARGIRANAEVGGDSCHRGAVVGSLLAMTTNQPLQPWLDAMPNYRQQSPM